jgi:hypothetical protein
MSSKVRLTDLTTNILNEIIRADAEFQLNQRAAWEGLDEIMERPGGINLITGLSRQENLLVREFSFEFGIVPYRDNLLISTFKRMTGKPVKTNLYKLAGEDKHNEKKIRVRFIIHRERDKTFKTEVVTEPELTEKKEDIYVAGIS